MNVNEYGCECECEWVWMWMCQNHIDITHWVSWMQFELLISVVWFNSIQFTVSIQLGLVLIFTPNKMCNSLLVSRLFHWHFSLKHSLSMIRLSHEKLLIFRCSLLVLVLVLLLLLMFVACIMVRCLRGAFKTHYQIISIHKDSGILILSVFTIQLLYCYYLYISTWNILWNFVAFTFHFIHWLIFNAIKLIGLIQCLCFWKVNANDNKCLHE